MIEFKEYWRTLSPDEKNSLAKRLHTSTAYLSQVAHGHRNGSKRLVEFAQIVTGVQLQFNAEKVAHG